MAETMKSGDWFTTRNKPHRICAGDGEIIAQVAMPPARMHKAAWQKARETAHARARLIATVPAMIEYIEAKAATGDPVAQSILEAARGQE